MRFSFEESELINNFFEDIEDVPNKEDVVAELEGAKENTEDQDLIEIAENTIRKIKSLDEETFYNIFSNLPVDTYTTF